MVGGGVGPGTIFGTVGNDTIDVFERGSLVFAGDGDNLVDGSRVPGGGALSPNILFGGRGSDRILAGRGDQVFGDNGDDTLLSPPGSGGNRLLGAAGDGALFAGPGRSTLAGDAGEDLFWPSPLRSRPCRTPSPTSRPTKTSSGSEASAWPSATSS